MARIFPGRSDRSYPILMVCLSRQIRQGVRYKAPQNPNIVGMPNLVSQNVSQTWAAALFIGSRVQFLLKVGLKYEV